MSFNRILIVINGSDCSLDAANVDFELAATRRAEVATLLAVAEALARHAPCPVLVVRRTGRAAR